MVEMMPLTPVLALRTIGRRSSMARNSGIGHVLSGGLAIFEPAVIGDIDDELWLSADKLASEAPDGVFKANTGDELNITITVRGLSWARWMFLHQNYRQNQHRMKT